MTDDEILKAALGYEHRRLPWWWAPLAAGAIMALLGVAVAVAERL